MKQLPDPDAQEAEQVELLMAFCRFMAEEPENIVLLESGDSDQWRLMVEQFMREREV